MKSLFLKGAQQWQEQEKTSCSCQWTKICRSFAGGTMLTVPWVVVINTVKGPKAPLHARSSWEMVGLQQRQKIKDTKKHRSSATRDNSWEKKEESDRKQRKPGFVPNEDGSQLTHRKCDYQVCGEEQMRKLTRSWKG